MSSTAPLGVENETALTNVFGEWPSFHDAEVLAIRFNHGADSPTCQVDVHVFKMTQEVDSRGYYVLKDHSIATLDFKDIDDCELDGFAHQNVLSELRITRNEDGNYKYTVEFDGIVGCSLNFKCNALRVASVTAYPRPGR